MLSPSVSNGSRLEQWLENLSRSAVQPTVITCDFDGTLTPRFPNDEDHFTHIATHGSETLSPLLSQPERIGGLCTSRSLLEVRRILNLGFRASDGRDLFGVSAAENGAVVFCDKLPDRFERKLEDAGFKIDRSQSGLTVVNLARVSVDRLREAVVMPACTECGIASEQWSSSVSDNTQPEHFQRLFEMSKHSSPERTNEACVRWGSAYVKVLEGSDGSGERFVRALQAKAHDAGVLCLVTEPMDGSPLWTADLGGGVTKFDGMSSISRIISTLSGRTEDHFKFLFFGDGENDIPAFRYISERPGANQAFLLDLPHGGNDERSARVAPGTIYLRGFYDLAGVVEGVGRAL
jgi:hypothetical protein